jgi:hypothetical protein
LGLHQPSQGSSTHSLTRSLTTACFLRRLLLRCPPPAVALAAAECFGVCSHLVGLLLDSTNTLPFPPCTQQLMQQLVSVGGDAEAYARAVVSRAGLHMAQFGVLDP